MTDNNLHLLVSCFWLVLVCSLSAPARAEPAPRVFLTHSSEGQTYIDASGEMRGREQGGRRAFYVELVREMMALRGHTAAIEEVPFRRGLLMVQENPEYAFFNVNRTPAREATVKWVGPLLSTTSYFYENVIAPTGIETLDDARAVESICVLRGNAHHRFLEQQGFDNIFTANSYGSCIQMLLLGRVNLTPLSNLSTAFKDPRSEASTRLRRTSVKLSDAQGFLVFPLAVSDATVRSWQEALDRIKAS